MAMKSGPVIKLYENREIEAILSQATDFSLFLFKNIHFQKCHILDVSFL